MTCDFEVVYPFNISRMARNENYTFPNVSIIYSVLMMLK